ncbi:MAG TPA: hypothetical protein VIU81_07115, partial [Gaiellaceae bacterium]
HDLADSDPDRGSSLLSRTGRVRKLAHPHVEPRLVESVLQPTSRRVERFRQASFSFTSWLTTDPSARPDTWGITSALGAA